MRHLVRAEDRERYILGRTSIRRVCADYCGMEPAQIRLRQTETGRPYLAPECQLPGRPIDFNIAHSGDCVVIAWALQHTVGIDVEQITPNRAIDFLGVAGRAFSSSERQIVETAEPHAAPELFYRIWVRKEALLKAEGRGIGGQLQSFSVATLENGAIRWFDTVMYPESRRTWQLCDLRFSADCIACLAAPPGLQPQIREDMATTVPA